MPFREEELRSRFAASIENGRMGHSYLLTGDRSESLENLAFGLAGQVLDAAPQEHPDFHLVRPESKSRHITVEQVRELERELYLRPFSAPVKVAVILDAERMCLGAAPAANAFLKTLEEPPAHTLILLTSGRSAMLLPTIVSRCLRLDLGFNAIDPAPAHEPEWIANWVRKHPNAALRAYGRAQVFQDHWAGIRETAEAHLKEVKEEMEEDTAKALVEAEFHLGRQESIAQLQRWYWRRSESAGTSEPERMRAVKALRNCRRRWHRTRSRTCNGDCLPEDRGADLATSDGFLRGAGENLRLVFGDEDGVLEMGGRLAIGGDDGPAVGELADLRAAQVDHGLDGDGHAGLELGFDLAAVVGDVRFLVQGSANAVPHKFADDTVAALDHEVLDGFGNMMDAVAGAGLADADGEGFLGLFEKARGGRGNLAHGNGGGGVANPAVEDDADVELDDVGGIAFSIPSWSHRNLPPMTPPAGPDISVRIGLIAAISDEQTPPFDCMMASGCL